MDNKPPSKNQKDRLSNLEVEERARAAEELLNNEVFTSALEDIYSRSAGNLVNADVGSLTAGAAHAMMKAIVEVRSQLEQYISDHKMRQKYHRGSDPDGERN